MSRREADETERVGLCADCRHARVQRNTRGSAFWRCDEADRQPGMLRYPPLPVQICEAFARPASGLPSGTSPYSEDP